MEHIYLMFNTYFLYHQNFHTLITQVYDISSIHHYFIFLGLQRSIGQDFYTFQKIIKKKRITKKRFCKLARLINDQFYLLISLEGMWSFIRSLMLVLVDVHLHNV